MSYRFHRQGDKRIESPEVEVFWTPSYQSYFSAGDDAEPYCSNCDESLQVDWHYCAYCGGKLVTIREDEFGSYKINGVD